MADLAVKTVVFDFFGVICPNLAALTGAEFSLRHGISPVEFSRFGHTHREALDAGQMSQLQFATLLQKQWHVNIEPAALCDELDALDGHYYAFDHRLHDLIKVIKPQAAVAVMSNVSRDEGAYLRSLGAYDAFDSVFLSGDARLTKSDPAWFNQVADSLVCLPGEVMLIDDCMGNVTSARAAGWSSSYWYQTPVLLAAYLAQLGFNTEK
ncbi:hypothetical protein HJC99_00055 [Candidatus Saccharibacteria bacterium]|nr:hypothetical protein [Candidatus Saccharibacteria bacterium]